MSQKQNLLLLYVLELNCLSIYSVSLLGPSMNQCLLPTSLEARLLSFDLQIQFTFSPEARFNLPRLLLALILLPP